MTLSLCTKSYLFSKVFPCNKSSFQKLCIHGSKLKHNKHINIMTTIVVQ